MTDFSQFPFQGKKALIRVDFNVPLNAGFQITDDTRMRAALPTIQKILNEGGSVILMSHLGRPKDGPNDKYSLRHLVSHLQQLLPSHTVLFAKDCIGPEAEQLASELKAGQVLLLENLRFYPQEEKGDRDFASRLAKLGDVYVNDAFGTAHRAHASTAIIASFFPPEHCMFGLLMKAEVEHAEQVMHNAQKPFTAIIGGAKVSDKILIIEMLLNKASHIIIGGGMAYTFLKAQGHQIGKSLCEDDRLELASELLTKAREKGVEFLLPVDSIVADRFAADAETREVENHQIPDEWMGLDIGSRSRALFRDCILQSKTVLWNGPMGVFEMEKFQEGTRSVAIAIAEATAKGCFSLIGGGDSVAAINQFHLADQVSYVSTGGGAMLEYFEGKQLPGIQAIQQNA